MREQEVRTQKKSNVKSHFAYYFVKYSHWEYCIGSIVQDVLFHYDIQFQFTVYYSGAHARSSSNLKCAHFSPSFLPLFSPMQAALAALKTAITAQQQEAAVEAATLRERQSALDEVFNIEFI